MHEQTTNGLSACERGNRWSARLVVLHSVILIVALASFVASCTSASVRSSDATAPPSPRASELVFVDPNGIERNVALTLDTRRRQVTLFVAGPDDVSAFQLWHGKDMIELRSDEDGSRLTAVRSGEAVMQQPPISGMPANSCAGYLEARSRLSREQLITACRRRFHDAACTACIQ